ncbi:hypothetical protein [Streptomyces sp. NPDC089799]|uniref:hypothetical protein n=1 Tax=Streptomyces sp. NPDC089799 TaxID=3155066 RepID=UPI003423C256
MTIQPGAFDSAFAACPDGKVATGGGISLGLQTTWQIYDDRPPVAFPPTGWVVSAQNTGQTAADIKAWVVCANPA